MQPTLAEGKRYEVLMDKRENPRKCTIHPIKDRADFYVRYFSKNRPIAAFGADCLLHVDGEDLSEIDTSGLKSLGLIDCTWKKVAPTMQRVAQPLPKLVRIPEGFVTAYPRRNAEGKDPDEGLATIEALFIAAAFLGFWDETLLEKYYFGSEFIKINDALWRKFKLGPYVA
jgi:pre-rRNA-processing protein TSR3